MKLKIKIENICEKFWLKIFLFCLVIKRIKFCGVGDKNGLVDYNINFILKNMRF